MTFDLRETILKEACSEEYPRSAICVQNFDDSLSFAIRITYRISLRSSSLREPRYPLPKVVHCYMSFVFIKHDLTKTVTISRSVGVKIDEETRFSTQKRVKPLAPLRR